MPGVHHFYSGEARTPDTYRLEGIAAWVYARSAGIGTPLYRFYNTKTDAHYYIISEIEKKNLEDDPASGWVFETIACWVATEHYTWTSFIPGLVPFRHFYHEESDDHFYTVEELKTGYPLGYVAKEPQGLVLNSAPASDRQPLYRYYNDQAGMHYYSTKTSQIPPDWRLEEVVGYTLREPGAGRKKLYRFRHDAAHYLSFTKEPKDDFIADGDVGYLLVGKTWPVENEMNPLHHFFNNGSQDNFYDVNEGAPTDYAWVDIIGYLLDGPEQHDIFPLYRFYQEHWDNPSGDGGNWFGDVLGDIGSAATSAYDNLAEIATTVVDDAEKIATAPITVALAVGKALIHAAKSLPIVGHAAGVADVVINAHMEVLTMVQGLGELVLSSLGIAPAKKLRLCVVLQNDEQGQPLLAGSAVVDMHLQLAIKLFKDLANVDIVPLGSDFIYTRSGPSPTEMLDVSCKVLTFFEYLGSTGGKFGLAEDDARFHETHYLDGAIAPLYAFSVRSISGKKNGCCTPLSDFATILFADRTTQPFASALAHELGHACGLPHVGDKNNLMFMGQSRGQGSSMLHLEPEQIAMIRASTHTTYI